VGRSRERRPSFVRIWNCLCEKECCPTNQNGQFRKRISMKSSRDPGLAMSALVSFSGVSDDPHAHPSLDGVQGRSPSRLCRAPLTTTQWCISPCSTALGCSRRHTSRRLRHANRSYWRFRFGCCTVPPSRHARTPLSRRGRLQPDEALRRVRQARSPSSRADRLCNSLREVRTASCTLACSSPVQTRSAGALSQCLRLHDREVPGVIRERMWGGPGGDR